MCPHFRNFGPRSLHIATGKLRGNARVVNQSQPTSHSASQFTTSQFTHLYIYRVVVYAYVENLLYGSKLTTNSKKKLVLPLPAHFTMRVSPDLIRKQVVMSNI